MDNHTNIHSSQPAWFVGAAFSGTDDQTERFLAEGIWENGYEDKYLDLVRAIKPGDRIAIKACYTRKWGLPFDGRGHTVSVMAIKATGVVTENFNDGNRVKVDWKKGEPAREWYFYTYRPTVWRVVPGEWMADGLLAFAFENKPQDLDRFQNSPDWRDRFGTATAKEQRFGWTKFYEETADKLLKYRGNRTALVEGIRQISQRVEGLGHLAVDKHSDGATGFVRDICPFTTMGLFNRGITITNRKIIAAELANFLGVEEAVPDTFEGIPVLNNLKSWYFPFEINRDVDHIDSLWDVFAAAATYANSDDDSFRDEFSRAFDAANARRGVAWNLTFGLYWIRPWAFPSLDRNSQQYIAKRLSVPIGQHGPKKRCSSADYLGLMDLLERRFREASYPVHSYPELSQEAWLHNSTEDGSNASGEDGDSNEDAASEGYEDAPVTIQAERYSVDNIVKDGCFLGFEEISQMVDRLRFKKNLILQGPPGTGKTWLAKRLAFALIGQKDERLVRSVQFHPNLSYEDFVRGWRPTKSGLSIVDGTFMEAIKAALNEPSSKFVVVIEEINRGNPAQIFGELLTLLEASKRSPKDALELCYPDPQGNRRSVHIPENLYVIGTMNVADRSLALVDLALRRRFAFAGLKPKLGAVWREWVVQECNVDTNMVADIERRFTELNQQIAADSRLGKQFMIGHSYLTPTSKLELGGTKQWFRQVIETEIAPLLDEYWFDAPEEAQKACALMTQGWD